MVIVQVTNNVRGEYLGRKQTGVAGHNDIAKVCNVLFYPRQVGWVIVTTIAVFGQCVALKGCGFENFRTSYALICRNEKLACFCVAIYTFSGRFPTGRTVTGVGAGKLNCSDAI